MNTTLRNLLGFTLLAAIVLAMACQCFGGAPTVVLDIPTSTATRMSPCPLFVAIDTASSSTGDSSTWDQCRIMWQLEADGSALDNWPSKYRYVTDPRPGLASKQIDLAGQTFTANFNRPRGFNYGWVLTAGTWRIKCTVTNPEGSSTTTTSSDITIAADTRTEFTVQASGGDETSLATLLASDPGTTGTIVAARDDVKITIEDGHTENLSSVLTEISGSNFLIQQAGTGTRPNFTWAGSGANTIWVISGEHAVLEGLQFTEGTGDGALGTQLNVFGIRNRQAAVYCHVNGSQGGNMFTNAFNPGSDHDGHLLLRCTAGYTYDFGVTYLSGDINGSNIIGCQFDGSETESTIRGTSDADGMNVCWSRLIAGGTSGKSALRFSTRNYCHAYGNYWSDGDNWCGRVTGGTLDHGSNMRVEANYTTGNVAATGIVMGVKSGLQDATACNNISYEGEVQQYLGYEDDTFADPKVNCRWLHNTAWAEDGNNIAYLFGLETAGSSTFGAGNVVSCNLYAHADGLDITGRLLDISDDILTLSNNVWPATYTNASEFARIRADDSIGSGTTYASASAMDTAEAWSTNNTEADITLDSRYEPSTTTSVTTASGVYDDYYGTPRGSTSWAGAVGETTVFQTFIPGVLIQQP